MALHDDKPCVGPDESGKTSDVATRIVTDELVEAVYADSCKFGLPGSAEIEKIRIRRLLKSAAPLLMAALTGHRAATAG